MEISQTTQAYSPTQATATTNSESGSSLTANSDFETFLKLLTTQMQNQDPLKPLESTEFVAQLASFSSVEQQILTNTRLAEMVSAFSESQSSSAVEWLGKRVLSPSPAKFEGEDISVFWEPTSDATRSTIEISDSSGTVVAVRSLETTQSKFVWDGQGDDGNSVPEDIYSFKINHFDGEKISKSVSGETYSEVLEVQIEENDLKLVLESGTTHVNQVTRIRSSQTDA